MLNQDVTGQLSLFPTLHICMYCEVHTVYVLRMEREPICLASGCNLFQSEGPPGARHIPASAKVAE